MNTVKKIRTNQKGFTLVELIVVVAILGVLAAVAVPNYMNYLYSSRVNTDISTVRAFINVARTYAMTNNKSDAEVTSLVSSIISEADMGNAQLSSTDDPKLENISLSADGTNGFVMTFSASSSKAGKYAGDYTVKETGELPKASKKA